jgi:hypothetical protein
MQKILLCLLPSAFSFCLPFYRVPLPPNVSHWRGSPLSSPRQN